MKLSNLISQSSFRKAVQLVLTSLILLAPAIKIAAQPIPVGGFRDKQFRILQLLSDSTITTSFLNRSLQLPAYNALFKKNNSDQSAWWGQKYQPAGPKFSLSGYDISLGLYEPVFTNTINTKRSYGDNNGAAWYGKGLNTELQAGFFATSKYVTVSLRPHLIYTQNRDFAPPRYVPRYNNGDIRYVEPGILPEYQLADRIDRPWRFGPDPYTTLSWGQSSVRLHYNKFEAGFSTENLWWGPGVRYALAMSNNAPGIPHAFIGTREPVALPGNIGDLEFQWILGWPKSSPYFDLNIYAAPNYENRISIARTLESTRLLNGLNVVYSPSFLPNLSIGLSRIIQQYVPDGGVSFTDDILGVFRRFPRPNDHVYNDYRDDSNFETKDPVSSFYLRWVFPKSNAEFYGELYKADHNINFRDFITEPQHGAGYTLGLQKLLPFSGPINFLKVNLEINSLLPGLIDDVRPQTYFYTHATIKQGYTNKGQIIGAAIGPGSASQYLSVDGYFHSGKIGLFVQRLVDDNFYYYELIDRYVPGHSFSDGFHHSIQLNTGIKAAYKAGPLLLSGHIIWNRNFNPNRKDLLTPSFYTTPVPIIDNLQYQLSVQYLF